MKNRTAEEFLIEVFCEETGEFMPIEISPNPWPIAGGDAEQLRAVSGGGYRWTILDSSMARAAVSPEWIKAHR